MAAGNVHLNLVARDERAGFETVGSREFGAGSCPRCKSSKRIIRPLTGFTDHIRMAVGIGVGERS